VKFYITRASCFGRRPCKEAVKESCIRMDYRTFRTAEEHDKKLCAIGSLTKPWLKEGMSHSTWKHQGKTCICREFKNTGWFVSFKNMEEFLAFTEKYGEVIVHYKCSDAKGHPSIEIYDTYRE